MYKFSRLTRDGKPLIIYKSNKVLNLYNHGMKNMDMNISLKGQHAMMKRERLYL